MTGTMAIVAILSGSAMGQNPQTSDSIANVELHEIKVLSARVPLTSAQTPQQVSIISHDDIKTLPINTIDDVLKFAVGIDVRQRGDGVQTDISIRGGSFDEVTVLLNGINITSPHTGHLSADFPISSDDIERVEILEGPSARVFGTQSFCGTINIVTKSNDPGSKTVSGLVNAFAGDHGHWGTNANITVGHNAGYNSDGSAARLVHNLSAGYAYDDGDTYNSQYNVTRFFYNAGYNSENVKANFQTGYSYKPYGANTFYGGSNAEQWESNEHFLISANAEITAGKVHINPVFSADRRYDHYQWVKDSPKGENFHRCDVRTTGVSAWFENKLGRTSIGAEMKSELIYSTKLGEEMDESRYFATMGHDADKNVNYTHMGDRTNITIIAEHDFVFDKWTVALAMPAINNTWLDHKWRFCPGMDMTFHPNSTWKFYANVNSALRMPTYTDLYYSGTNIVGTDNLDPERSVDYSAGVKFRNPGYQAELRFFGSNKNDMIDWVIASNEPDGKTYRAVNFEQTAFGTEVDLQWLPREIWSNNPLRKLELQYAYIDADNSYDMDILASKYAQEFIKHKFVASLDIRIVNDLSFTAAYRYKYRIGENNDPYSLVDCGLNFDKKHFAIYANVTNLFDEEYADFSYIIQSGRRFVIGAKFKF